jgi:hypothetical protein
MESVVDLEALEHRNFAFYPPVLNVEHNEWCFRKATWSEMLVVNAKSGVEVWIPRRLVGDVSSVDEPVMIVGLLKELEYKAGTVWPHEKRVLEMPRMAGGIVSGTASPAPPPPASRASRPDSRAGRLIAIALGVTLAACLLILAAYRLGSVRPVKFTAADQDFLSLTRHDDYYAVVQRLGPPGGDHWRSQTGELQFRALWYPQRGYYVVLFGVDRRDAHYIGALDSNWRMVHYVDVPGGGSTASMLRSLPRF